MRRWLINVLGAWSQFWNAVWGGDRDQTFSSRCEEARLAGRRWAQLAVPLLDALFFWEPGHCAAAFAADSERSYRRRSTGLPNP